MAYKNGKVGKPGKAEGSQRKKGRGRPPTWTPVHQKKLLILGLCGVQTKVIKQVFNYLYGEDFAKSDRTLQDILAKLLSPGWRSRDAPCHKSQARLRTAHLRALKRGSRPRERISSHQSSCTYDVDAYIHRKEWNGNPSHSSTASGSDSFLAMSSKNPERNQQSHNHSSFFASSLVQEPNPTISSDIRSGECFTSSQSPDTEPDLGLDKARSFGALETDRTSVRSNRSALRQFFRRESYSSSLLSDLASILRSSCSSSAVSFNALASSCSATEIGASGSLSQTTRSSLSCSDSQERPLWSKKAIDPVSQVTNILAMHSEQCNQFVLHLEQSCCSGYRADAAACIHADIAKKTELQECFKNPYMCYSTAEMRQWIEDWQTKRPDQVHASETLFYAAKIGAPACLLISLVEVSTSINATNKEGQTFLFFLDPKGSLSGHCSCSRSSLHSCEFECLVRTLERNSFNFDQMDHDGRHFLTFLLAQYPDAMDSLFPWIYQIPWIYQDEQWKWRLTSLSGSRDASGCFLIDFTTSINDHHVLKDLVQPLFNHSGSGNGASRTRSGEDSQGKTELVVLLERCGSLTLLTGLYQLNQYGADINHYDPTGLTPLMRYLDKAFEINCNETSIVESVTILVALGANVNARSRNGSTVLQYAAKRALPKLLVYLISVGAQLNHCDNNGWTALDYAGQSLKRSKSHNAAPEKAARSLKTTVALLDRGAQGFNNLRGVRKPAKAAGKLAPEIASRSLQCYDKLVESGAQLRKFNEREMQPSYLSAFSSV